MLRWDMLGYGSSVGVGFAWISSDQLRQLCCSSFGSARVRLVKFYYVSVWQSRCVQGSCVALRFITFRQLWLR